MIPTPLQPIRFDSLDKTCCEVLDYRYEIQADDEVVLQVIVGACDNATEEITNTEINTVPWVRKNAEGGILTPSGQLFTDFTVEQPVTMVEGTWYEIKLTIQYPNSINTVVYCNTVRARDWFGV